MFNNGWRKPSDVMSNYLDRIGAGWVLANPEVFNFDYVPEELVGREDIQNELASKFTTLHLPEGSGRVVITGPVGSGKTALAQTFAGTYNVISTTKGTSALYMSTVATLPRACALFNASCTN